jgi:hypothetical protein
MNAMVCHRIWILALGALCLGPAAWQQGLGAGAPPVRAVRQADDADKLAARIDEHIQAVWARSGVRGVEPADDAVWLRRVTLDVTGKIPSVTQARQFLADSSSDKRRQAVERLLDSPGYANHMTNIWRDLLVPEANSDFQRRFLMITMERWLLQQFGDNAPWDRMARELVTFPMPGRENQMSFNNIYSGNGKPMPLAFYIAKEGKPEELAAHISRLFLGVRIECAQCHDHPFGKWKREEFWGQAAFFAGVGRPRGADQFFDFRFSEVLDRRELAIPNTDRVARARFLDGQEPRWKFKTSARVTLADWMTAPENPFFARAAVNRLWAQFFGIGLVDPVDDMNNDLHPASHPELLDELAREFVTHKFDLKHMIRAITLSRTYQQTSRTGPTPPDLRLFARMPVKGLTADQVYDSLVTATGIRDGMSRQNRIYNFNTPRQEIMDKFASQERPTDYQTSIPQVLTLMNNRFIADACNPARGTILGAVTASSFMSTEGQIETLYLAVLSRKPRPEELSKLQRYVEAGGTSGNSKKALSDVYWALLNSPEFLFNH